MKRSHHIAIFAALAACAVCAAAAPVRGEYQASGFDLGLVSAQNGLANSAGTIQTVPLWFSSGPGQPPVTATFTLPQFTTVDFSRLYLDLWGGNSACTATVSATLNGDPLPTLTLGGEGDANTATRNPNQTCVYGSGYGVWQIAYAGISSMLNPNGANTLSYVVTPTNNVGGYTFDGRAYGATLATVYTDPSINQTLDYQLFEADGTMRQTVGSSPPYPAQVLSRSLTVSGVNTANVTSAQWTTDYTYGGSGLNQVYFNGTALGGSGNNVASQGDPGAGYYPTELHTFSVAANLSATDSVVYSISSSQLGGTGASVLRADIGLLTVTHPSAINGVWTASGSGSWGNTANWSGGNVPANQGDTASFGPGIGSNTATIVVSGSETLGGLTFATTGGGSYVLTRTDASSVLTLANGGNAASLAVNGGAQTIAVPIVLGDNLSVSLRAGGQLTISGPISQTGGSQSLSLSGGGELILSGTNSYTGGTTIEGGTLDIAAPSALPGSGLVTIAAGGRLVLGDGAGIGALLTASSPTAAGGEFDLSAAQSPAAAAAGGESGDLEPISQNPAMLGDAPSLAPAAAAVPEPATSAMLAAGLIAFFLSRKLRPGRRLRKM